MDEPVTDVVFVSDPQNCPYGYTVVTECPCGHSAQLWEKVYGGADNTRYLCFTKDPDEDKVIESMYIPGGGKRYLLPGYEVIARTEEGERDPLRHKQLALKKVPRKEAKKVVADVVVAKGKDDISKLYTRLEKINGVRICFRQTDYTYKPTTNPRRATFNVNELTTGTAKLSMKTIGRSQSEERIRSDDSVSPTAPSAPVIEETVSVKLVETVASAPPPSMLNSTPPLPVNVTEQADSPSQQSTYPPQPRTERSASPYQQPDGALYQQLPPDRTSYQPSANTSSYQQPPPDRTSYQASADTSSYQQPPPNYAHAVRYYPPPTGYGNTQQYRPPPGGYGTSQQYPPPPGGYNSQQYPPQGGGGYPPQPTQQPRAYPPAAPPGDYPAYTGPPPVTTGYDTSIGFSFGGTSTSHPVPQPGHTQYPPTQYGGPQGQYPPSYPPATTGQSSQAPQNSQPRYGFNF